MIAPPAMPNINAGTCPHILGDLIASGTSNVYRAPQDRQVSLHALHDPPLVHLPLKIRDSQIGESRLLNFGHPLDRAQSLWDRDS